MSLKTKVKAGNITNLSDARYCAGMGVDWLGFPANTVNPVTFKEITDWVAGPEFVLELHETTTIDSIGDYPVSIFEISSNQLNLIDRLQSSTLMVRLSLSQWGELKSELLRFKDKISYLVMEPDSQDLNILSDIALHFRILINQSETHSLTSLLASPVVGINVTGENELKPGLKDFERLSSILEELEILN
jgi:phosphoribosylanthranilate isomerase